MNYQHLLYFRTVAIAGGISAAAQRLRLTPPTLSAQIRTLEESFGVPLFERTARGMSLTDHGRIALRYADRIFALGAELEAAIREGSTRRTRVGVETSIVASTVRPLLAKLAGASDVERVVCTFGAHDELMTALKALELDVVFTTTPVDDSDGVVARRIAETEVAFFANEAMTAKLKPGFPASLQGAAFVAPAQTALREAVERRLAQSGIRLVPTVEIADASLAAALAADGVGIVVAPLSAATELARRYDLALVGIAEGVRARIHAATPRDAENASLALLFDESPAPDRLDRTDRLDTPPSPNG